MLAKRLAAETTLVTSFVSKGFPYKDQIEELFLVMVSFYIFATCNIFNFLINFNCLLQLTFQGLDIVYLCRKCR